MLSKLIMDLVGVFMVINTVETISDAESDDSFVVLRSNSTRRFGEAPVVWERTVRVLPTTSNGRNIVAISHGEAADALGTSVLRKPVGNTAGLIGTMRKFFAGTPITGTIPLNTLSGTSLGRPASVVNTNTNQLRSPISNVLFRKSDNSVIYDDQLSAVFTRDCGVQTIQLDSGARVSRDEMINILAGDINHSELMRVFSGYEARFGRSERTREFYSHFFSNFNDNTALTPFLDAFREFFRGYNDRGFIVNKAFGVDEYFQYLGRENSKRLLDYVRREFPLEFPPNTRDGLLAYANKKFPHSFSLLSGKLPARRKRTNSIE